jgi:hypothetical protein
LRDDGPTKKIDPEVPSLMSKLLIDPDFAMVVVLPAGGIFSKQEASPNSAIHDVHDCDFVCSKNLNTSQSSHASPQHAVRNGGKPEQSRVGVYRPNAVCSQSAVSPLFHIFPVVPHLPGCSTSARDWSVK